MRTVLYIISKSAHSRPDYQFIFTPEPDIERKTIFLGDRNDAEGEVFGGQVYHVDDEPIANTTGKRDPSPHSVSITYRDLLNLIFATDGSIVV